MAKKTSKTARPAQKSKTAVKRKPAVSPAVDAAEESQPQRSQVSLEAFRPRSGPSRGARASGPAAGLTPADEYRYVRADLTRVLWIGGLMVAILVAFSFVLR